MRIRNPGDPTTRGEVLDKKFRYHVIPTTGEPLVHVSRSRLPEIVVFGHEQRLKDVKLLRAGKRILVMPLENGDLRRVLADVRAAVYLKARELPLSRDAIGLARAFLADSEPFGERVASVHQQLQSVVDIAPLAQKVAFEASPMGMPDVERMAFGMVEQHRNEAFRCRQFARQERNRAGCQGKRIAQ